MKYLFWLIVLICVVHGLVIHGSPLLKVRSSNLIKRCTPGNGKGDCRLYEKCDSAADCKKVQFFIITNGQANNC
ncbi:15976_t:CDS:2 [Cetraspora pellucida]|uniref:15976_t:CDS:1 n=1 Tax=Cetraspora pellucida TaxID=1433469 RepID=A0A9N9E8K7_9GLOM|nr:15976_t:CDS:2 [Cetraspora pellucida]